LTAGEIRAGAARRQFHEEKKMTNTPHKPPDPRPGLANAIENHAYGMILLGWQMRRETALPALGVAVAAIIQAADEFFMDKSLDVALEEVVASLVGIFGADKVRAAIDRTEENKRG
jgi:hypothetical protein